MRAIGAMKYLFVAGSLFGVSTAGAQASARPAAAGSQAQVKPAGTTLKTELIAQIEDAERKMIALAEAIPQDKYGWRPAAGVRSISEVFVHVISANYFVGGMTGVKRDTSVKLTRDMEATITDKARIVEMLKQSFAFARRVVTETPDSELDASVNMFGRPATKRAALVVLATHNHEHLGQQIAYARMNGIVPPWSAQGGD